ncbi:hypothetical protein WJX84_011115, partial [Apatococcus fuscideae]
HRPPTADSSSEATSAPYLTLKRLAVWLREPTLTLRLLASLADGVAGLGGGALVRQISVLAHHGDPFLRACLGRMLTAVSAPLVEMVRAWLFDGRLDMPPGEFFIRLSPTAQGRAGALWAGGFQVEESMRPPFVSALAAAKILRTGKSINFLRECCGDTEWLQSPGRARLAAAAASLSCTQVAQLEKVVDEAAADIDAHLLTTLFKRFNLAEHFAAVKRYLLLGQGDFIQALMDLVGSELGKPAGELSEYSLNGSLDAAVRASSAQYDSPDILDRLRLRLHRQLASDTGWDVFVLQYSVTEPLATVLSDSAMASYLRVFRLLWSLKRVEHALATTWQLLNSVQRQLSLLRAVQRQQGTSHHQGLATVWVELRAFHSVRTEMAHFCSSLQSYIVLEVLEACWGRFMDRLPHAANLEALIAAHSAFLEGLLKGALLGGPASAQTGDLQAELQAALRSVAQLPTPVGKLQELVAVAQTTTRARLVIHKLFGSTADAAQRGRFLSSGAPHNRSWISGQPLRRQGLLKRALQVRQIPRSSSQALENSARQARPRAHIGFCEMGVKSIFCAEPSPGPGQLAKTTSNAQQSKGGLLYRVRSAFKGEPTSGNASQQPGPSPWPEVDAQSPNTAGKPATFAADKARSPGQDINATSTQRAGQPVNKPASRTPSTTAGPAQAASGTAKGPSRSNSTTGRLMGLLKSGGSKDFNKSAGQQNQETKRVSEPVYAFTDSSRKRPSDAQVVIGSTTRPGGILGVPEAILDSNNSVDGIQGVPAPVIVVGNQTRAGPLKASPTPSAEAARDRSTTQAADKPSSGTSISQQTAAARGGATADAASNIKGQTKQDIDTMVPQQSENSSDFLTQGRSQYGRGPETRAANQLSSSFASSARPPGASLTMSTRQGRIWDDPEEARPAPAATTSRSAHLSPFQASQAAFNAAPAGYGGDSSKGMDHAWSHDAELLHERSQLSESSPTKTGGETRSAGAGQTQRAEPRPTGKVTEGPVSKESISRDVRIVDRAGSGTAIPHSKGPGGPGSGARPAAYGSQMTPTRAPEQPSTARGVTEASFSTPKQPTGAVERTGLSSHAIELSADKYGGHYDNGVMTTQEDLFTTADSMPTPRLARGQGGNSYSTNEAGFASPGTPAVPQSVSPGARLREVQGYGANPVKKGLAQSGSKDQLALDSEGEDWLTAEGGRRT